MPSARPEEDGTDRPGHSEGCQRGERLQGGELAEPVGRDDETGGWGDPPTAARAAIASIAPPAGPYRTAPSDSRRVATNAATARIDQRTTTAHGSTSNGMR